MVAVADEIALFPLIEPGHPFYPQVRRFAEAVAARPRPGGGPATVHAEVKALRGPDGSWRLDRFYWSRQTWGDQRGARFQAETLTYRADTGATEWQLFPHDSYLDAMAGFFDGEGAAARVLRYVPLRRLTFRIGRGEAAMVGKFKRRSRFREAHARLEMVADAVARADPGFRVARPLALDEARCLGLQEALPGRNLAELLGPESAEGLLYRLGGLSRALHELAVPAARAWDEHGHRASVGAQIDWICFMRPELGPALGRLTADLQRAAPPPAAELAFCHGDLAPSQILAGDDGWSAIDFDLCRMGDPHHELAMLLAALPHDAPAIGALDAAGGHAALGRLEDALLRGYQDRAGRGLDQARLSWHRACAEIYYLALGLKKGWLDRAGELRALARLQRFPDG